MSLKRGFSTLELLLILVILGILFAISSSMFGNSADVGRATSDVQRLISKSRFVAIKRNRSVVVNFSSDNIVVYVDLNRNKAQDSDEPTLERWKASDYRGNVRISSISLGGGNLLIWSPEGQPNNVSDLPPTGLLRFEDGKGTIRELTLSSGGFSN